MGAVENRTVGSRFLCVRPAETAHCLRMSRQLSEGVGRGLEAGWTFSEKVYVKMNKVTSSIFQLTELSKCDCS